VSAYHNHTPIFVFKLRASIKGVRKGAENREIPKGRQKSACRALPTGRNNSAEGLAISGLADSYHQPRSWDDGEGRFAHGRKPLETTMMMTEGQSVRCVQGLFMERHATCTISIYQSTVCTVLHAFLAVRKYLQNEAEGTIAAYLSSHSI
jgi:hypothetical protein